MAAPRRKMSSAKMVNRILRRSSGICQASRTVLIISDHLRLTTRSFDFFLGGGGEGGSVDGQLLADGAVAQDLDAVLALGQDALLQQSLNGDSLTVGKLGVQGGDVHRLQGLGKTVVETALGQAAGQRHLAALEAHADAAAGAGPLALLAAAGGLTVAGAVAAALAVGLGVGTGGGGEFMQIHCLAPPLSFPRIPGAGSRSEIGRASCRERV